MRTCYPPPRPALAAVLAIGHFLGDLVDAPKEFAPTGGARIQLFRALLDQYGVVPFHTGPAPGAAARPPPGQRIRPDFAFEARVWSSGPKCEWVVRGLPDAVLLLGEPVRGRGGGCP